MIPRSPALFSRLAAALAPLLAVLASTAASAFDEPVAAPAENVVPPAAAPDGVAPRLRPIPEIDPAQFELPDFFHDSEWLNDPFTAVETDMSSAIADLDVGRTHPPAEFTQPMIIERLDVMIEMLEKACKKAGGSGGGGGPRGANASILRSGKDQRGPMRAVKEEGRKWAELTPQEREKILQSKTDGFPAGYDDILADYFRKLSRGAAEPVSESPDAQ